jgi:hypothetical protein
MSRRNPSTLERLLSPQLHLVGRSELPVEKLVNALESVCQRKTFSDLFGDRPGRIWLGRRSPAGFEMWPNPRYAHGFALVKINLQPEPSGTRIAVDIGLGRSGEVFISVTYAITILLGLGALFVAALQMAVGIETVVCIGLPVFIAILHHYKFWPEAEEARKVLPPLLQAKLVEASSTQ